MATGRRIIKNNIEQLLSDSKLKYKLNEPLSKHTTLCMGGCAKIFIEIETEKQLIELIKFVTEQKIKFYVLGGGSNILFDDNGFDGIIIKLTGDFKKIEITDNILTAGAGTFLAAIINKTSEQSLSGLEHLTGIPGTLGGAIFGNAGVKNYEISTFLSELEIINYNGEKQVLQKNEVNFEYRKSNLTNCIITKAKFILKKADKNDILQTVLKEQENRKKNQPFGTKNAGCIFKNPLNDSAGRIIDSLNLKNFSIGAAEISNKHANFFINKSNASSADMLNLINFVRDEVYKKYKIKLETEIKIVK